ncbi:endonuclease/exonuclease/phosphatase family protein [Planobispora siamensis]|uniref:Endonuclease/exonuclease/phosphatase n=1 Tax=Planobispora siamensis TaxID=936338 RepID=A0A8J3SK98_9ACTN|nr:endonuclease/exonuclease/phosphatase family protein [Planobispora siamensis]GIH96026.1 endonuclease/exonuclease/phosphatase [Planobispora siamensis]
MRFATFNVLHGRPVRGGRPLPFPAAAGEPLAEAVAATDADVLALQEVDRFQERSGRIDQAALAARRLGACDWRYASALHGRSVPDLGWVLDPGEPGLRVYGPHDAETRTGGPSHGIALLSRVPVRTWRARRLPAAPVRLPLRVAGRPGLTLVPDQPRAVLAAVLEGRRRPFTVVAAHLSFVPGWNAGQLTAIRRWIADLPAPHVLLGDLNLVGPLPRMVLTTATGLDDLTGRRRPGAHRWRALARTPTYPAHRPRVQFDHVLATGLSPGAVRGTGTPPTPVSDHRPLVVDLAL